MKTMKVMSDLTEEESEVARQAAYYGNRGWGIRANKRNLLCPEGEVAKLAGVKFEQDSFGYLWPLKTARNDIPGWMLAAKSRDRVMCWLGLGFTENQQKRFTEVERPQYNDYDKKLKHERQSIFKRARY